MGPRRRLPNAAIHHGSSSRESSSIGSVVREPLQRQWTRHEMTVVCSLLCKGYSPTKDQWQFADELNRVLFLKPQRTTGSSLLISRDDVEYMLDAVFAMSPKFCKAVKYNTECSPITRSLRNLFFRDMGFLNTFEGPKPKARSHEKAMLRYVMDGRSTPPPMVNVYFEGKEVLELKLAELPRVPSPHLIPSVKTMQRQWKEGHMDVDSGPLYQVSTSTLNTASKWALDYYEDPPALPPRDPGMNGFLVSYAPISQEERNPFRVNDSANPNQNHGISCYYRPAPTTNQFGNCNWATKIGHAEKEREDGGVRHDVGRLDHCESYHLSRGHRGRFPLEEGQHGR